MSIVAPAFSAAAIASSSRTVAPVVRLGEVGMLLEVLLEALLVGREAEEPVVLAQPLEVGRVEINPAPGARAIDDQQGSCALDPPGRQRRRLRLPRRGRTAASWASPYPRRRPNKPRRPRAGVDTESGRGRLR